MTVGVFFRTRHGYPVVKKSLGLQPHLVILEVLLLVVACAGAGLVASSPAGPVVSVCPGV
jgi:hypothetical protein